MSVCCECCQAEVSATGWSLVQRSHTYCVARCVISRNLANEDALGDWGSCCAKKENYGKRFWSRCEQHGIFISCCTTVFLIFFNKGKFLDIMLLWCRISIDSYMNSPKRNIYKWNAHTLMIYIVAKFLKFVGFWTSSSSRNPKRTRYGKRIFSCSDIYCIGE